MVWREGGEVTEVMFCVFDGWVRGTQGGIREGEVGMMNSLYSVSVRGKRGCESPREL